MRLEAIQGRQMAGSNTVPWPQRTFTIPWPVNLHTEEGLGEEQVIKRSWVEGLWLLDMLILELSV